MDKLRSDLESMLADLVERYRKRYDEARSEALKFCRNPEDMEARHNALTSNAIGLHLQTQAEALERILDKHFPEEDDE